MNLYPKLIKTGIQSILYDYRFLKGSIPFQTNQKLELVIKKYYLLTKHHILEKPVLLGKSKVNLFKKPFYYESELGISALQTMIVKLQKHYLKHLKHIDNPVIIDVGAHIGFFSLPIAEFLKSPTIYAIEPVRVSFNLLKINTSNYKQIKIFNLGLSDVKRKSMIHYKKNKLAFSSLLKKRFLWTNKYSSQPVQLTTLDKFAKENTIDRIDILKIDTEGYEFKILKGAQQTLQKTHYLILECIVDKISQKTFSSTMSLLKGRGFDFQLISFDQDFEDDSMPFNLFLINVLFKEK